jgi:formylglycine-generating enzyme required for sulfatase activity/serine/threonine protein kinase
VDPARYLRLSELFAQARGLDLAARAAFLDQVGSESESLRAELEAFLAEDDKEDPDGPLRTASWPENPTPSAGAEPSRGRIGQHVGRYEILEEIGRGGTGVVYKVWQTDLHRTVALKMLLAGAHAGAADLARFQKEAAALARLQHPHVVQIYEVGEQDGVPYFAFEFVAGGTLAQKIKGLPQPARQAAQLVATLAQAMHFAHQHGIVHRDLKPANVLLQIANCKLQKDNLPQDNLQFAFCNLQFAIPKITDFSLVKRLDTQTGPSRTDLKSVPQTHSGAILGTPSYMAPEQAGERGQEVGPAADVYALGAILYEMLTGRPPFLAETPLDTMLQVLSEDPVPPRRLLPKIPRDLETICLKCLHKEAQRRYPSAEALAADLQRFLAGEPIHARPVRRWERALKWIKRKPAAATLLAGSILAVVGLVTGAFWYDAHLRQARDETHASALVDSLITAKTEDVPNVIKELAPYQPLVGPRLRRQYDASPPGSAARLHLSLALLSFDATQVEYLRKRSLSATPSELRVIRDALRPFRQDLKKGLWKLLQGPDATRQQRIRAASLLAGFDPDNPLWTKVSQELVAILVSEDPLLVAQWAGALQPVQAVLREPLQGILVNRKTSEEGEIACSILAQYAADEPEVLVDLLRAAEPRQVAVLAPRLRRHGDRARALLDRVLTEPGRERQSLDTDPDVLKDDLAKLHARVALALIGIGRADRIWPLLERSEDPRLRSYLIDQFAPGGVDPVALSQRLDEEGDPGVRQALLLALGGFRRSAINVGTRERLLQTTRAVYRTDPDPGVHSAAEWLLRRWGQGEQLRTMTKGLVSREPVGKRRWYVNGQGHTLAVVATPVSFPMGSPRVEWIRDKAAENQHRRHIGRAFAIGTKEVTREQFLRFAKHRETTRFSPEPNCPIVSVSWYEAARYCRWLSEQEGVPEKEMCYPKLDEIGPGMKLPAEFLARTGYRLPTETEWEYACRAGTVTRFCFGADRALLPRYGVASDFAEDRAWPVGRLKPNELGLFDVHGNVDEWCQDAFAFYPAVAPQKTLDDGADPTPVSEQHERVLRGGRFGGGAGWVAVRCASRRGFKPSTSFPDIGFRIARTVKLPTFAVRLERQGTDQQYTNSIGMEFAMLPPGEFRMGSDPTAINRLLKVSKDASYVRVIRSEGPAHRVRITRPFYMGRHHVTVGQFQQFVDATGYKTEAERDGQPAAGFFDGKAGPPRKGYSWRRVGFAQTQDHPVVLVTSRDAQAFCAWLSRKEGRDYRLPTEAQWEYACRAGQTTDSYKPAELDKYAWHGWNSGIRTQPVGKKRANAFGLYDLLGNAQQWCSDWHGIDYYAHAPRHDPTGPTADKGLGRVIRGGSYASHPRDLRFARRDHGAPDLRTNWLGVRVALALPPSHPALRLKEVTAVNEAEFRVLGPAVPFRIREVRGGVDVSPRQGKMPAVVRIVATDRKPRHFSFVVERTDTREAVTASGVLFSPDWDVKFYSWDPARPPQSAADWQKIFSGKPLEERKTTELDFDWGREAPGTKVPCDYFGLVATTELNIPSGQYEVGIVASHGYRIFIDGKKVIDEWLITLDVGRSLVDVKLREGKHLIRVEYCKGIDEAQMHFSIQSASRVGR